MRLRGKYLCWLFVMMVFCAVSFGGCGGSSTASISGSEDITVPDSPDIPAPAPATPDTNAVIFGTWRVESGTYAYNEQLDLQATDPETFTLSIRRNDDGTTYSVILSEVVSLDFGVEYDGEKFPVPFSSDSYYELKEDGSGYISEEYSAIDASGRPVHGAGDRARELITEGSDTLQYIESYVNSSATAWNTRMQLTLKRVN